MRRIAADIDASAMSLYRHVTDKDHLLLPMMDAAMREWRMPADPPQVRRARMELGARTLWTIFRRHRRHRRHRRLAPALSLTRPQPLPAGMAYTEGMLEALGDTRFDLATTFDIHLTVFGYIRGTAVNLELEAEAEAATGLTNDEWVRGQEQALRWIAAGRFPHLARLMSTPYDLDLDALFERGLHLLLDGLALQIDSSR